jgi:hypothetical protein
VVDLIGWFWEKGLIKKEEECWIWKGKVHPTYKNPMFISKGRKVWVHRLFYRELVDKIPKDGYIFRMCKNNRCCNPQHMRMLMKNSTTPLPEEYNEFEHMHAISKTWEHTEFGTFKRK